MTDPADPRLDALDEIITSGVRETQAPDGSRVAFRSLDELEQIRGTVVRRTRPAGSKPKRQIRITGGSGL